MPIETWDKNEIKRLADTSGKPLEVECAGAFLKAKWHVRLGTFYTDVSSEKIRELDFLAERSFPFKAHDRNRTVVQWDIRVRLLGSCKGFPSEYGPATYSVSTNSLTVESPQFICYHCGLHGSNIATSMRKQTARRFLHHARLADTQQVIGFDILQRKEELKKGKPHVEYSRKTDRDLYEGLDSAIKAAIFWYREDRHQARLRISGFDRGHIVLNIPLLICSKPFWNVSIDGGAAGEPEVKGSGFHVSLYPSGDSEKPPEPVMSVLWEAAKLEELTHHLDNLCDFFIDEIKLAAANA